MASSTTHSTPSHPLWVFGKPWLKLLIRVWSRKQSELVGQSDIYSHASNAQKTVTGQQLPVWNVPCTRLILLCVLNLQVITIVYNSPINAAGRSKCSQENNVFVALLSSEKNNNIFQCFLLGLLLSSQSYSITFYLSSFLFQ